MVSYAVAGFIALAMMFSLSEMAVMHPAAGSFGTCAELCWSLSWRVGLPWLLLLSAAYFITKRRTPAQVGN